jgi:hypothetical protein
MAGVACYYCCCYEVAASIRIVVLDAVRQQDHHDQELAAGEGSKTEGPTTTPQRVAESGRPAQGLSLLGEIASLLTVENLSNFTVYERRWETCITAEQTFKRKPSNENYRKETELFKWDRNRDQNANSTRLHSLAFEKPYLRCIGWIPI